MSTRALATSTSLNTPTTCKDVIQHCDAVIEEQSKQIWVREQEIEMMEGLITDQYHRLQSADAWYNSRWLWLAVGAGATGYLLRK